MIRVILAFALGFAIGVFSVETEPDDSEFVTKAYCRDAEAYSHCD